MTTSSSGSMSSEQGTAPKRISKSRPAAEEEDHELFFETKDMALAFFKTKYGKDADRALIYDTKYSGGKQSRYRCKSASNIV